MKCVPICFVFTDQLESIKITEESFELKSVQVRKTATYGDLKKRIMDCAANMCSQPLKLDQLRMWTVTQTDDVLGALGKV